MMKLSAASLREQIQGPGELALVDVREGGAFANEHLLFAVSVPLARLEMDFGRLVPRLATPIVLCDEGNGGLGASEAAQRLCAFGYCDVHILENGIAGWKAAGFELFSGVNVPSKAFGEFVESVYGTPHVSAQELKALQESGTELVVLDSRPLPEFQNMNIPGGVCCPGAELVYRVHDLAPDPDTLVVVNCAGRTRSIIGSQSLINAGIPNRVVALKDGTMGWHLAGYALERGQSRVAPKVSARGLECANAVTERVAARFSVPYVSLEELEVFRHQADARSLFVMDVRSPAEFKKGHLPGSRCAPGGQLVQATDEYAGVRNARLVLVDDTGVRATSTASWLIQMGWSEVYVLDVGVDQLPCVHGVESSVVLSLSNTAAHQISIGQLAARVNAGNGVLFDLADSLTYRQGHLPGARMIRREEVPAWVSAQPFDREVVLLSPDGVFAGVAAGDVSDPNARTVSVLAGGTKAWQGAGYPIEVGEDPCRKEEPADIWYKPYERRDAVEEAMQAYLDWELGLVAQVKKDGCATFRRFDQ